MKLKDSWYNCLKWVAILLLPALATLVAVIGNIWNIPVCDPISQTITAIGVFLGAILGISSIQYKKDNENG